jgi:hypothetical protein
MGDPTSPGGWLTLTRRGPITPQDVPGFSRRDNDKITRVRFPYGIGSLVTNRAIHKTEPISRVYSITAVHLVPGLYHVAVPLALQPSAEIVPV